MGAGEQLDLHGVESDALSTTVRILDARINSGSFWVRDSAVSRAIRIVKVRQVALRR
jgi:hypothetical protein